MTAPDAIHVAPLPDGHEASPSCWCLPLRSAAIGQTPILVHRVPDPDPLAPWAGNLLTGDPLAGRVAVQQEKRR